MEYCFTLRFSLPAGHAPADEMMEVLAAAGCDDALIGLGTPGRIALEFTRESGSATEALAEAEAAVLRAIPGATLVEAAPDFVGLTDVAELIGMSRQNMRKLMLSHRPPFPLPVHDGKTAIWHLADVLEWLNQRGNYALPVATRELAQVTRQRNLSGSLQRYGLHA